VREHERMTYNCAQCGEPLSKKQIGCKAKFCSKVCYRSWYEEHRPLCRCGCGQHLEAGRAINVYCKGHQRILKPARLCKCGCGTELSRKSTRAVYVPGHNPKPAAYTGWEPYPALIVSIQAIGFAHAAARIGLTKNALIGRMYRRGYRFGESRL
jgi:hypothetical protein